MDMNEILDRVSSEHPYKVPGDMDTYSQYNEAWQDCIARIEQELDLMKQEHRFEFDFSGVESFECPCGRHYVNMADKGSWIPVEERLPEEKVSVLAQWEKYDKYLNVKLIYLDVMWLDDAEKKVFETINGVPNGKVIAWRPLPEPYQAERSMK